MTELQNEIKTGVIVNDELCLTCGACVAVCPQNGLFLLDTRLQVNPAECIECANCVAVCPVGALSLAGSDSLVKNRIGGGI